MTGERDCSSLGYDRWSKKMPPRKNISVSRKQESRQESSESLRHGEREIFSGGTGDEPPPTQKMAPQKPAPERKLPEPIEKDFFGGSSEAISRQGETKGGEIDKGVTDDEHNNLKKKAKGHGSD